MCHAKSDQNQFMGMGPGHNVSFPWSDGLEFKLSKTSQDIPDLKVSL
jgi:hypothetical protein